MKRSTPLARVTPLRQGAPLQARVPLPARVPLARTVPVRRVSARRARENRERRAMVKALYAGERPLCAVWDLMQPDWCTRWADDAHEPLSRARLGSITDPANHAPLCRACHNLITDEEPDWAYEAGLLVHSWDASGGAA